MEVTFVSDRHEVGRLYHTLGPGWQQVALKLISCDANDCRSFAVWHYIVRPSDCLWSINYLLTYVLISQRICAMY